MKAAFAAIIGRPSVGKSTLLNALCGHKVSIVAPSPQTTRNAIRGILSSPEGQIVFLDTPGFHNSEKKMNRYLRDTALHSIQEIDLILYVIDLSRPPGREERELMKILAPRAKDTIVALNKADLGRRKADELEALLGEELEAAKVLRVSAASGEGLDELKTILYNQAEEGEPYYPEEYYTDQDPSFRASEIIREQAINRVGKELPHAIYVEIADMEERSVITADGEERFKLWIRAFLMVERESQKGILVGKKGTRIAEIKKESRKILQEIFPQRIELDLRVKVNPKWRSKDPLLKNLLS